MCLSIVLSPSILEALWLTEIESIVPFNASKEDEKFFLVKGLHGDRRDPVETINFNDAGETVYGEYLVSASLTEPTNQTILADIERGKTTLEPLKREPVTLRQFHTFCPRTHEFVRLLNCVTYVYISYVDIPIQPATPVYWRLDMVTRNKHE